MKKIRRSRDFGRALERCCGAQPDPACFAPPSNFQGAETTCCKSFHCPRDAHATDTAWQVPLCIRFERQILDNTISSLALRWYQFEVLLTTES